MNDLKYDFIYHELIVSLCQKICNGSFNHSMICSDQIKKICGEIFSTASLTASTLF